MNKIKFQWFDMRNDDTCNLKCKYCGPASSTLWKKELNIPVTRKQQINFLRRMTGSFLKLFQHLQLLLLEMHEWQKNL